jgi:hypothetical protein
VLIVALHGAYGNGAFMEGYSRLSKLADRAGLRGHLSRRGGRRLRAAADRSGAPAALGGAHAWPRADSPDAGPQFGVSASEEAWSFLRDRRLSLAVTEHHHR